MENFLGSIPYWIPSLNSCFQIIINIVTIDEYMIRHLVLYSYVVLFGFRWDYQYPELSLYLWILILILGEIRECFSEPSKRLKNKLDDYIHSVWNKFDVILALMAILGFALRQFKETFWYARITFAFNCAGYYVRVFRIYHASQNLGPKLVIFHKMVM